MKETMKNLLKSLKFSFHIMSHPFDGFWDLKWERIGTPLSSTVIVFFVILMSFIRTQYTGYIFNSNQLENLNIITTILSVLLPFFLWCLSNWALTTLFDGEGSFKDVCIYTAYALVPLVLFNIPVAILSNYIISSEQAFLFFFSNLATVWFIFLLMVGTLTTHQYTAGKTILMMIFIVLGMAIILFIGLLFFILIQQIINFVIDLLREIALRVS